MTALRLWLLHLVEWLLLGLGLGCLGIYAYETVEARRFQSEQAAAFEREATAERPLTEIRTGSLIGMLDVPRLELSTPVIEGDDTGTLKRAVGHLPDTPMPWDQGNSAVAGHRDGLFRPLKDVKVGDEIRFRTTREELRYRVTKTSIVKPDDLSVLEPQDGASTLTLITCYPFYYVGSAPKRFIVHAERLSN
ncbi:MAG TPA: class D sortase [Vicinamibacterales bacterium]